MANNTDRPVEAGAEAPARSPGSRPPQLTYIIGTYPLLTTTFIDREIRMLRAWGADIHVISIRRPGGQLSPEQIALAEHTHYVLPASKAQVVRHHLRYLIRRPGRYLGVLFDLMTYRYPSWRARLRTVGHFGLAVHVAGLIAEYDRSDRLHAHFIDRAATVALVAGTLLDLPYSVTAHANDIYVNPILLEEKLARAEFVATCTGYNEEYLSRAAGSQPVELARIYHGLELDAYPQRPREETNPPLFVAVGQLKEKKGFGDLLVACRTLLDEGHSFRCEIIGEGPLRSTLEAEIAHLGLGEHVALRGALHHGDVIAAYRRAAVFVLPCVVAADGDRDGIPNVILEASALELPVISTRHSGIPEAVEHERTGLLVAPHAVDELAAAMARMIENPEERHTFGRQGRSAIADRFDVEVNVKLLYEMFAS